MTGWQRSLMGELYMNVRNELAGSSRALRTSRRQRVRQILEDASVPSSECDWFFKEMPAHYIYQSEATDVLQHYAMLKKVFAGDWAFEHVIISDSTAVFDIALPYTKEVLSEVTAVCAGRGCFIVDARCWRVESEYILFRFTINHVITNKLLDASWWSLIEKNFQEVLRGNCDVVALLEQRKNNMMFEDSAPDTGFTDPAVKAEQKTSNRYSIFDVHHKDEPGSMSVIARAIYQKGFNVDYASVSAMGDIAACVFYVQNEGTKLSDEQADDLCQAIAKELKLLN
ncbi:MAG: hypothetical protein HRU15_14440 [Planctomycetes bacterium]|nr:hypothetical protein [Planctomycetota bacterium]